MAAAADVTFDVLLGGKLTPQVLKAFKDLEEMMKKQGASAKTVNAIMARAYKETFDKVDAGAKQSSEHMESSFKEAFHKIVEHGHEMTLKVQESFDKIKESINQAKEAAKGMFEFIGIGGLLGAVTGALGIEELVKKGIEVRRERATEEEVLAATLRGRGREAEAPEWSEAAERIAATAHVGHKEAMEMMRELAASGRFSGAEQAKAMAMSLVGLGGGTAAGAESAMATYQRMLLSGKINPRMIAKLGAGSGINVLEQLSRDTGIPVADLQKQFGAAKISKKTGEVTGGALAGAKGIDALNKAILELGQSRGFELIKAHMSGLDGLFYRFGEHWEDFTAKIGEFVEEILSPLANEINELIDKIDFREVFAGMIENAKQWGHAIQAVWDMLLNTPVMNQLKTMWEGFWKTLTGGVDLYGKAVLTWADPEHTHKVMARHLTAGGRAFVDMISEHLTKIAQAISDTITRLTQLEEHTRKFRHGLAMIAGALNAIDDVIYGKVVPALWDMSGQGLQKVADFANAVVNMFDGIFKRIWELVPDWLKPKATFATAPGQSVSELAEKKTRAGEEYTAATSVLSMRQQAGEISVDEYKRQIDELKRKYDEQIAKLDAQIKTQTALDHSLDMLNKAFQLVEAQAKKTAGNDLVHLNAATETATASLSAFTQQMTISMAAMTGFGGGAGGFAGAVSGAHFTEYGPAVAGDQPGGPTYDYNSYHHIGAWPSITGPLRLGDVALGYGAQAKYHVSPGQTFTDEYGRTWRFADRSGSKDPYNVDVFKGAMGGIFKKATRAIIGESGPEAVLPLSGVGAAAAGLVGGLGGVNIHVNVAGHALDPESIAAAVETVMAEHFRRAAVV